MVSAGQTLNLQGLADTLRGMSVDPASLDYTHGLKAASVYLSAQAKRCFSESRTPDGAQWPPLKNPSRRRGGRTAKPLVDKGLLMASMSAVAATNGAVRDITKTSVEHGSNLEYAGWQNDGTRTIPARPFVGITDAMAAKIETIIADDVARQMGF